MDIYISSLEQAHKSVDLYRPARIISFIDKGSEIPFFLGYDTNNHLVLPFNDNQDFQETNLSDAAIIVSKLIRFLTEADLRYAILIHCLLGISRSTAAAYVAMNLHIRGKEYEFAQYLRNVIPYAMPNQTIIKIADQMLGKEGSMVSAIRSYSVPDMREAGGCKHLSINL